MRGAAVLGDGGLEEVLETDGVEPLDVGAVELGTP
ncbi:hypothetical protein ABIB25_003858 [Nakamurella sp. UYEF19]